MRLVSFIGDLPIGIWSVGPASPVGAYETLTGHCG